MYCWFFGVSVRCTGGHDQVQMDSCSMSDVDSAAHGGEDRDYCKRQRRRRKRQSKTSSNGKPGECVSGRGGLCSGGVGNDESLRSRVCDGKALAEVAKENGEESIQDSQAALREKARVFAELVVNAPFSAATAKARENEAAAWRSYNEVCAREFWHEKPESKGRWPLPVRQWCELLVLLRRKYGSYNAFCNAINMVCKVGSKAAHNVHIAESQRAGVDVGSMQGVRDFDPRVIYQAQHRSTMDLVRRDSGVQVKHTEYINMEEARNGHKFTDHTSLPGLQESACWNMENLSGGRRPRSIAALRVRHLRWTVTSVKHSSGNSWLAPSLTYEPPSTAGSTQLAADGSNYADMVRHGGSPAQQCCDVGWCHVDWGIEGGCGTPGEPSQKPTRLSTRAVQVTISFTRQHH